MSGSNNTTVYGGDEINAIVLDPGSFHTRIGYAGDDFPKVVTSSCYASPTDDAMTDSTSSSRIFGEAINVPRANYKVSPILKDSIIEDWDAAVDQYSHYFKTILNIEYPEHPLLVTEPVWAEHSYRKTMVENFYEHFDFAALYLAKAPTCISFQQGRSNCLVVDIGHDSVSVTPVIDGISLLKNSMRTHYAGQFLSDQVKDFVDSKQGLAVQSTYKVRSKTPTVYPEAAQYQERDVTQVTTSFDEYQQAKVWHEFKETVFEIPEKSLTSPNPQTSNLKEFYSLEVHRRMFEFPTGQSVPLGFERFQLAESIFDPVSYKFHTQELADKYPANNGELKFSNLYDDYKPIKRMRKAESSQSTPTPAGFGASTTTEARGLSQLITHTLSTIDIDLRASVAHNIIVTGGLSLIPQLTERLYNELCTANPGLKIRLHAAGNSSERVNQAWIGGSVLASLGTFHQMWVSKEEYEEAGAERILNQRFR
ncbi:actin-related protein [Suhomyces tanzawaensis NRRL Y-17324]|uniref:Actin-related protein 4 n=1 Tax=Suhomyces tanzawaensis NRRL Y-17324 TaxID=984487 RepID=A0A1E4SEH1_9ASCO|nr:actin-related protein [Suhomyces tanzawaensis NRRL Y-17324]ODV77907.1 actin-related protein [Suhomyces tanzawaensis NRRL Y-17324]